MKKLIGLLLLAILVMPSTVYADVLSCSVKEDFSTGRMIVSGEFEKNNVPDYISLRVLKEGYSFDNLPDDKASVEVTEYIDQISMDEGQETFEISFVLSGSTRSLKAQIFGEGFASPWDLELNYINKEEFCEAVDAVNAAAGSYEAFAQACAEDNRMRKLGFNYSISDEVSSDEVLRMLYESIKGKNPPLDKNNSNEVLNVWKAASLAVALNKNISLAISENQDCLNYFGEKCQKWVGFIVDNPDNRAQEKLYGLLSGSDYANLADFEADIKESLVLTVIKYPDGNGNVGAVLKEFSEITGITVSNENKIYDKMAGKDYDSIPALLEAYEALKKENTSSSQGSGGGGGGGSVSSVVEVNASANTSDLNEKVNMKFVDLDTVDWAYEAISTLADRGIINGKSDTLFAPLETVTREEFVKMLVCVAGYENNSHTTAGFIDVTEGAWYAPYVNIAAQKGMVSGTGQDRFGIGKNISRQDMTVIIYRFLTGKGISLSVGSLTYDDSDSISDYAKEAVSVLSANSVVNGVGNNLFNPKGTATRAEAAKIIFNVLDKIGV